MIVDPYITEWLNLILRFLHVVTAIAWIGASFYFIWLDNHLRQPPQWKIDQGVKGDLWAIHGGGFYEVAKYQLAPPALPTSLHWFKWEAYSTWITGFFLLALIYYVGAESYLIDKRVLELTQWQAIAAGLGVIAGGWLVYDYLCESPLARYDTLLGILLFGLLTGLSFGLTQIFSARGAYIHVGAVIGTIMVGNVFRVIMPSQRALVDAVAKGEAPDPVWGVKAKLRSTHNTYTTLPVVFIMISNHYPITYQHSYSWAVLAVIILITAIARQYFVLRHKRVYRPSLLIGACLATLVLAVAIAPSSKKLSTNGALHSASTENNASMKISIQKVEQILMTRCASCHSPKPTDSMFLVAPGGVFLHDLASMQQWAPRIKARSVDTEDMPFMNKTAMTLAEREYIGRWINSGAPIQ